MPVVLFCVNKNTLSDVNIQKEKQTKIFKTFFFFSGDLLSISPQKHCIMSVTVLESGVNLKTDRGPFGHLDFEMGPCRYRVSKLRLRVPTDIAH